MTIPTNILQQVITYQDPSLAYLQNLCCFASTFNAKYKDFQNKTANLGDTVNLELPTRSRAAKGLVASFQGTVQRLVPLVCDQASNASRAFTTQQFIFNADQYMDSFGKADIAELGAEIEINLALNAISGVPVYSINGNGQSIPTGALHTESGPYRFYGNGTTALNSYQQVAQILANYKDFGSPKYGLKMYLPDTITPGIIGNGLNQFAPKRNDDIAMSWSLGAFAGCEFYESNLLPIHTAGTLGNDATVLTVVSTDDPTGANITEITCSGAGTDSEAIFSGDLGQFQDGVSGFENMRFLTFIGHTPSAQPVQFRVTADAASSGGNVTFSITPSLQSAPGSGQNLNQAIQAGMQIKFLKTHRAGLLVGGEAAYLAMPMLPDETPYPTSSKNDPETGLSLRMYYGSIFGQNQRGLINDAIWSSLVVPEYSMRIVLPV